MNRRTGPDLRAFWIAAALIGCQVRVGSDPPAPAAAPPTAVPRTAHAASPPVAAATPIGPAGAPQHPAAPALVRTSRAKDAAEYAKMEAHVRAVRPSAIVHSFHLGTSHDADCVPINKQPAAGTLAKSIAVAPGHPPVPTSPALPVASANKNIRFRPTSRIPIALHETLARDESGAERRCPAGSVPLRRIGIEEVAAFKTLAQYKLKARPPSPEAPPAPVSAAGNEWQQQAAANTPHEHAAWYAHVPNQGGHAAFNVWAPPVESGPELSEFSLAQIWVVGYGGTRGFDQMQTVEAGFQVWPSRFNDALPHLFVYSTSNGYGDGSCYEPCGHFVQTSSDIVIGAPITSVQSSTDGAQYDVEIAWWRNADGWWLFVHGEPVGYYPSSLFAADGLANGSSQLGFGGEIVDDMFAHPTRHTQTRMGSGDYAAAGWAKAAFVRDIFYYSSPSTAALLTPSLAIQNMTDTAQACYQALPIQNADQDGWRSYFFFGGPGLNPKCPTYATH